MKRATPHLLHGRFRRIALIGVASLLAGLNARAADTAAAATNQLQSIDVQQLAGNQLQLTLHLSGPAP